MMSNGVDLHSHGFYTGHHPTAFAGHFLSPPPPPPSESNPQKSRSFHHIEDQFAQLNLFPSRLAPTVAREQCPPAPAPSTFTPTPLKDSFPLHGYALDDDPSLEYLHYSMDALVQRLVPTDTYIPKVSSLTLPLRLP